MTETAIFEPGGYRYVRGPFQYSGGVAAEEGYAIERIRFQTPVPLEEGFRRIEAHLDPHCRPRPIDPARLDFGSRSRRPGQQSLSRSRESADVS